MAQPAPTRDQAPPIDPTAIDRAYRFHRAKRRARVERTRARRRASWRFLVVLAALVALAVFLGLTVWHQIQNLFGL